MSKIIDGMARALFVLEWSDREDEHGRHYPGQALEHVAPETPRPAFDAAHNLAGRFERLNGYGIKSLLRQAAIADGMPDTIPPDQYAENFGHFLAMQALGHGVGWFDDHARFPLRFPVLNSTGRPNLVCLDNRNSLLCNSVSNSLHRRYQPERYPPLDTGACNVDPRALHLVSRQRPPVAPMTAIHWLALCAPFLLCLLFDLICTRWGKRAAWAIIVLCLAYLSVKP